MAFRGMSPASTEALNKKLFEMHQKLNPGEWSCSLETGSELSNKEILELLLKDVEAMHAIMAPYYDTGG